MTDGKPMFPESPERRLDPRRIELVDPMMVEVLRAKTPAERLAIAASLWRHAQRMTATALRREHPEWSDAEIQRETARRLSHGAV
ncbi:MAG: hypothetical protein WD069_10745 [Planctomycetales bacterium]